MIFDYVFLKFDILKITKHIYVETAFTWEKQNETYIVPA